MSRIFLVNNSGPRKRILGAKCVFIMESKDTLDRRMSPACLAAPQGTCLLTAVTSARVRADTYGRAGRGSRSATVHSNSCARGGPYDAREERVIAFCADSRCALLFRPHHPLSRMPLSNAAHVDGAIRLSI